MPGAIPNVIGLESPSKTLGLFVSKLKATPNPMLLSQYRFTRDLFWETCVKRLLSGFNLIEPKLSMKIVGFGDERLGFDETKFDLTPILILSKLMQIGNFNSVGCEGKCTNPNHF